MKVSVDCEYDISLPLSIIVAYGRMFAAVFVEKYTFPSFLKFPSSQMLIPDAPDWTPFRVICFDDALISDRRLLFQNTLTDAWTTDEGSLRISSLRFLESKKKFPGQIYFRYFCKRFVDGQKKVSLGVILVD